MKKQGYVLSHIQCGDSERFNPTRIIVCQNLNNLRNADGTLFIEDTEKKSQNVLQNVEKKNEKK